MELMELLLEDYRNVKNGIIMDNIIKGYSKVNSPLYKNIFCSISGGSDSDIMLDIVSRLDKHNRVHYVWFDTGLEYEATKKHLDYLEKKYSVKILREKAIKPIPVTCREYGQPFLSKMVSNNINTLQKKGFKWEDKPYEQLVKEYCKEVPSDTKYAEQVDGKYYKGCIRALKWWCNRFGDIGLDNNGNRISNFNINRNRLLKEFMVLNPPDFNISSECCKYAKKEVSNKLIKDLNIDLMIIGLRKAEGGG